MKTWGMDSVEGSVIAERIPGLWSDGGGRQNETGGGGKRSIGVGEWLFLSMKFVNIDF